MARKLEVGISRLGSATRQGPRLICQLRSAGFCPQACHHVVSRWLLQLQHHFLLQLHSKKGSKPHPHPPSGLSFEAHCPEVDQMTTPKPTTAKGALIYHNRLRLVAFSRDRCGRYHWPLGFWKCTRLSQQPGSAVGIYCVGTRAAKLLTMVHCTALSNK